MLFTSFPFVAFFALVAAGFQLCPARWRVWYLLIASYAFYCTWSVEFAGMLLGSSVVAFVIGTRIAGAATESAGQRWLVAGVAILFVPLVVLKYGVVAVGAGATGWGGALPAGATAAIGISYYTFKLASYLIDVHWQRTEPVREFSALATFPAFFPQIVSGPIQRSPSFMAQLRTLGYVRPALVVSGLRLMLFGFFKKEVVADRIGVVVDQVFSQPHHWTAPVLTLASYLFAIQLYADFSGLTDIAIGVGRVVGIDAPPNFDAPFYADNIQEFWRRWHMTLTGWLSEYLFTPLRMALRDWGQAGLVVSIVVNMLAIGLWHGASWTFVAFGLIQAAYMVASALTMRRRKRWLLRSPAWRRTHAVIGPLLTFHMVVATMVFVRAASVTDAWYILWHAGEGLFSAFAAVLHGHGLNAAFAGARLGARPGDLVIASIGVVMMETVHILKHNGSLSRLLAGPVWVRWAGYYALGFSILLWGESGAHQFIYARF